eukprot:Skav213034  [mRNA]  locus=scaffold844:88962:96831:+ [translate_table: standard]
MLADWRAAGGCPGVHTAREFFSAWTESAVPASTGRQPPSAPALELATVRYATEVLQTWSLDTTRGHGRRREGLGRMTEKQPVDTGFAVMEVPVDWGEMYFDTTQAKGVVTCQVELESVEALRNAQSMSVQIREAGASVWDSVTTCGDTTQCLIQDLKCKTDYEVRVAAVCEQCLRPAGRPLALNVTAVGTGSATVQWYAGAMDTAEPLSDDLRC